MGGSQKSKKVAWASDVNLCQVRLFLSEESPSQVGLGTQDHLQEKTSWPLQSGGMGPDDNLPPGFEGIQPANLWKVKLSQVPLITWRCPPRFEVNIEWGVVAGEESIEREAQNQREMRVLEAIYPRPSAIPPNPSTLVGEEDSVTNDQNTPVVPITPIEDEDTVLDTTFVSMAANSNPMISHSPHLSHGTFSSSGSVTISPRANEILATGVEPDIVAAAQAALTSIMSNNDQGNLIDPDLLIEILRNPKMVEQLVTTHGASSGTQNTRLSSMPSIMPSSNYQTISVVRGQTGPSFSAQRMPSSHVPNVPVPVPSSSLQSMPTIGVQNFASSVHNITSTSTQGVPNLRSPPKNSYDSVNIAITRRDPLSAHISRPELIVPSMSTTSLPFHPPNRNLRPPVPDVIPAPSPGVPMTKDINYYKSLIQQHGEERREVLPQFAPQSNLPFGTSPEPYNVSKSRDSKQKIMKPCMFFNSSRGCRNGANCAYQHDMSAQQRVGGIPEAQSAKRMKLDREITGS